MVRGWTCSDRRDVAAVAAARSRSRWRARDGDWFAFRQQATIDLARVADDIYPTNKPLYLVLTIGVLRPGYPVGCVMATGSDLQTRRLDGWGRLLCALAVAAGTLTAIIVGGYLGLVAVSGLIANELSQINAGPNGIGKGLPEIVMVTIYGYGGMGLGAMIGGVLGLMLMLRLVRQRIVPWMRTEIRFVQECEDLL